MAKIVPAINNNIELQMMVLNTIDEYETAARAAQDEGKSTGEILRSAGKRKRATTNDGLDPDCRPIVDPPTVNSSPVQTRIGKIGPSETSANSSSTVTPTSISIGIA